MNEQGAIVKVAEASGDAAQAVSVPTEISGKIETEGDTDDFKFSAKAGQQVILEVDAARSKSMPKAA